jgi:hypothetical protein
MSQKSRISFSHHYLVPNLIASVFYREEFVFVAKVVIIHRNYEDVN